MAWGQEGEGYLFDEDWRPETREPESFTEQERAEIIQRLLRTGKIKESDVPENSKYLIYLQFKNDN